MSKLFRLMVLLLLCVFVFTGCADNKTDDPAETSGVASDRNYSVRVENLAGTGLANVIVSVYSDETLSDLIQVGKTNGEGVFVFSGTASDGYAVVLSKVPVGYQAERCYPLTGDKTTVTLDIGKMSEDDMNNVSYFLGDAMMDFTFVASDAQEYTLSDLLDDHEAVMLNFWFMGCNPCLSEFPHLQEAYEKYGDDIAVLAMNAIDSDNAEIEAFRKSNGYTFPMGKCDARWSSVMRVSAFPFTVMIDRYGNISLMHCGAVPDSQIFMDLFAYYSADDYKQGFYDHIQRVPGVSVN